MIGLQEYLFRPVQPVHLFNEATVSDSASIKAKMFWDAAVQKDYSGWNLYGWLLMSEQAFPEIRVFGSMQVFLPTKQPDTG